MRKLPRFVLLQNREEEISGIVMETVSPYFMGRAYEIPKKETERVEEFMSGIVNGRELGAKVPGYTIFMIPYGTLDNERLDDEEALSVLRDMAEYYARDVISKKRHRSRIYQEGVPDDIDERNGRIIREARERGEKAFIDRR